MEKLKVIVVDDVEMTRIGLKFLLDGKYDVIAEASNGRILMNLLTTVSPDLILMDVNMPIMNGIEATRDVTKLYPNIRVIALTNDDAEASIEEMTAAGAKGFLMKKVDSAELQKAIEVVKNGGTYFAPELISYYNRATIDSKVRKQILLTGTEEKVLHLLCQGYSLKEIADKLWLELSIVESACNNLSAKTSTKNAVGLVLFAIKNKMVTI